MNAHLLLLTYSPGGPLSDGTDWPGAKSQRTVKQTCKSTISLCKPVYGAFARRKNKNGTPVSTVQSDTEYTQYRSTYTHTKQEISKKTRKA